jgi:8-oxo-dGTP pyrophosphatase MutT (NUDIX family)
LVQGRYTGKWSFPKGHSNEGEEPIECTLREVGEETGIDKLPDPLEYLQIGYGNYFVFDLKESIPLIPRDTQEIMDTKWVSLDEMERMSLNADASLYRKKLANFKSD